MSSRKKWKFGGRQPGAGRKTLTGKRRENRVVAFLDDEELEKLDKYAREEGIPTGRAVYRILARSLKRRP